MNNRQNRFIEEYLVDFNATQAAIRAGYSYKTARQIGSKLLTKVDISEAVEARIMSEAEVRVRLSDIARGDVKNLMSVGPMGFELKLMAKDDEDVYQINPYTKLIKKIRQKVTTIMPRTQDGEEKEIVETDLELYSALEALSLLGKHHKLFTDKTELSGPDGSPVKLEVEYVNTPYPVADVPSGTGDNSAESK